MIQSLMKRCVAILASAVLFLTASVAVAHSFAEPQNAVGFWMTRDHQHGNKYSSVVHITKDSAGILTGKIVHIFPIAGHGPKDKCVLCKGARYNKPILGMDIVWDFKADGIGKYDGGRILDPTNGKIYKSKMWVSPNGQELTVRGYIGIPIMGRSVVWYRTRPTGHH